MKIIFFLLLTFLYGAVSNGQKQPTANQKNCTIEKVINSQWTFNYIPDEKADKGYESPEYSDSRWLAVSLPHTWNTYETTGEFLNSGKSPEDNDNSYWWRGWGWYRKHFSVNPGYSGRKVTLEFDKVQEYCKVWLNGKYLGDNKGQQGSFGFDISGFLNPGGDNLIAVAINNSHGSELDSSEADESNSGIYSGLGSDVTLVLRNKLFIPEQSRTKHEGGVTATATQVSKKEAVARIQTWVKNDNKEKKSCTLQTTISDAEDKTVQVIKSIADIAPGQLYRFDQTSKPIKKPHLWSNEDPFVYKLYTEVIDGNEIADAYTSSSGLKISLSADLAETLTAAKQKDGPEDVFIKNLNRSSVINRHGNPSGEPARIVLTSSLQKISADRGSVAIITAEVTDSKGNFVTGANNTVKWAVSGPATLAGPSVFESCTVNSAGIKGYLSMPVSNVIRSTGKPGTIHVAVFASGLASGSVDIVAEEVKQDNSVIIEPALVGEGRKPVVRKIPSISRLDETPQEIKMTSDNISLSSPDRSGYAQLIRDYIIKNNSSVDTSIVEFKTIIDLFASYLVNNNGHIIVDDYNYNVGNYNNCRLISAYINSTKLPPAYKEGLRKHYSDIIITKGNDRDAGDEMNWLNWIPSGGTVIISQPNGSASTVKGTMVTTKNQLTDIIAVVHPEFVNFSDDAKERALIFINKMNPYVHASAITENSTEGDKKNKSKVIYLAEEGETILIPLFKFIAE
ncbi:MAG: beta galactosidase jelly roll domain-containing protein [Bacteroidales bacterium]|nr:beta galactosidase jelly roll domain-containing protein [Bacteroidales bacterium]